jgi:hypothetical protein
MSPDTDRIAVPTNGKRPHPMPQPATPVPVATEPAPAPAPAPATASYTPTQLAVGFAILAAVIALLAGSLRRRTRAGRRGLFGRR